MMGNCYQIIVIMTVLLLTTNVAAFVVLPTTTTTSATATTSKSTTTKSSLHIGGVMALNRVTGQSQLDPTVIQKYLDLPMPEDTVLAEYVWVDAVGNTRSKTRTLPAQKVSHSSGCCLLRLLLLLFLSLRR